MVNIVLERQPDSGYASLELPADDGLSLLHQRCPDDPDIYDLRNATIHFGGAWDPNSEDARPVIEDTYPQPSLPFEYNAERTFTKPESKMDDPISSMEITLHHPDGWTIGTIMLYRLPEDLGGVGVLESLYSDLRSGPLDKEHGTYTIPASVLRNALSDHVASGGLISSSLGNTVDGITRRYDRAINAGPAESERFGFSTSPPDRPETTPPIFVQSVIAPLIEKDPEPTRVREIVRNILPAEAMFLEKADVYETRLFQCGAEEPTKVEKTRIFLLHSKDGLIVLRDQRQGKFNEIWDELRGPEAGLTPDNAPSQVLARIALHVAQKNCDTVKIFGGIIDSLRSELNDKGGLSGRTLSRDFVFLLRSLDEMKVKLNENLSLHDEFSENWTGDSVGAESENSIGVSSIPELNKAKKITEQVLKDVDACLSSLEDLRKINDDTHKARTETLRAAALPFAIGASFATATHSLQPLFLGLLAAGAFLWGRRNKGKF